MKVCPQCGYERTTNDDSFLSNEECPKCGIFYKKWKPSTDLKRNEPICANYEVSGINEENKTKRQKVTNPHYVSKDYTKKAALLIGLGILCLVVPIFLRVHGYWWGILKLWLFNPLGFVLMWAGTIIGLRSKKIAWLSIIVLLPLILLSFFYLLAILWGNKP